MSSSIYELSIGTIDGLTIPMEQFRGRVLLLVNTASACGFTPQYAGLEQLHRDYGDRGLTVIGFPCNQFGSQEPGTAEDIAQFCQARYGVTFLLSEKIEVNGDRAHPLFRYLKQAAPGLLGTEGIKWNFTKFLVDRAGQVVGRYAPTDKPETLRTQIEQLLQSAER